MKAIKRTLRPTRMALIVAAAGLLPLAAAQAQNASTPDMQARYNADMQRCATLTDPDSKRTCQREAGAALQEARRNRLSTGQADTAANSAARCARLPAAQRTDCERLMTDSSSVEHGSVSGGGIFRELTITVPAETTAPAPGYGTQPVPAPNNYPQQQPAAPAPAPGAYGTTPVR